MPVFNKLVRDNIPDIIIKEGRHPITGTLSDKEYELELLRKLYEEVDEVIGAYQTGTRKELIEEISDVKEVLTSFMEQYSISSTELNSVWQEKNKTNGRFKKKIFLKYVKDD